MKTSGYIYEKLQSISLKGGQREIDIIEHKLKIETSHSEEL